jgi:hypothetical protein
MNDKAREADSSNQPTEANVDPAALREAKRQAAMQDFMKRSQRS